MWYVQLTRIMIIFAIVNTVLFDGVSHKATAGGSATDGAPGGIVPQKTCIVFTKESWGCLGGREILADVTQDLTANDGKPVLITEVKNPEDVDNRLELYLYYPSQEITGSEGFYVLRLGVTGSKPQVPGTLQLAEAFLVNNSQGVSFVLKAKITGHLKPGLLFAGDTQLASGLFTCAEADLFEAQPVNFLGVYPIRSELSFTAKKIDAQWDRVTIRLDDFILKEGEAIAACYGLLTEMQNKFSASNEHLFLWDQFQLTPHGLNLAAASYEHGRNCRFHVNIELHDPQGRTEIQRDSIPFDPQLRQMIAVKNAQGKITGGSVMIAVEEPAPK